ncbi:GNAT family N-acetyltransferase [Salinibacterium sp. G-O1]|uniref:GNAT family N-acetyltransferase n=1 Tax=Salinibacterium sp. G-O1 TaxID=3046208 RepID=UPI0024BA0DB9|nr:GNAT family N-acetyltransferase [Salinibacterium sp. G-O1]MDJ0335013.1 GNAT family N-acetyltransferase [Salinibacterium sp. G-O1]
MSTTADTSPASTFSLRPAVEADYLRVFALLQQLEGYSPEQEAFDKNFALLLHDEATTLLLVSTDSEGSVVGYALTTITPLLHVNGSSAQLQELAVDVARQGEGIGTALVEEVERLCREREVRQLTVPSRRSADFYERIGYRSTADFLKRTLDD